LALGKDPTTTFTAIVSLLGCAQGKECLIPNNPIASPKLSLTLHLRLSQLGITRFYFDNRGLTFFFTEKIPFLHNKVTAPTDFLAVVPLHGLVESKAVFGNAASFAFDC